MVFVMSRKTQKPKSRREHDQTKRNKDNLQKPVSNKGAVSKGNVSSKPSLTKQPTAKESIIEKCKKLLGRKN
jgi:hypothetical protein